MTAKRGRKKTLLDRSIDIIRDVRGKMRQETGRAWKLSGLRVEVGTLRRRRAEALRQLGEAAHLGLRAGSLDTADLTALSARVDALDRKIWAAENEIATLDNSVTRRRALSADKGPRQSRRLEATRPKHVRAAVAESVLPIDPLEDILGAVEESGGDDEPETEGGAQGPQTGARRG